MKTKIIIMIILLFFLSGAAIGSFGVRWTADINDGEWHNMRRFDPFIVTMQTGPDVEIGFRSDGVVVWREYK